jgi:hypothetical protein
MLTLIIKLLLLKLQVLHLFFRPQCTQVILLLVALLLVDLEVWADNLVGHLTRTHWAAVAEDCEDSPVVLMIHQLQPKPIKVS